MPVSESPQGIGIFAPRTGSWRHSNERLPGPDRRDPDPEPPHNPSIALQQQRPYVSDLFKLPHVPLSRQTRDPVMPKNGDALIIVRSDGTTGMLICGIDMQQIRGKIDRGEDLTEQELAHIDVADRVLALYLAANSPKMMELLRELASDPEVLTPEFLASLPSLN